ncbi:MAG: ABC transporter permease [Actinomycetales bacterium]|nr:ABC transporter permease [Actinomycetales bacterium]
MTTSSSSPGGLAPRPGAAPRSRILAAQTGAEIRMTLRNGEQLLLTLVIPVLLLVGLSHLPADVVGHSPAIDAVTPGILALAVISTAFTGLAIATGFERRYGVLTLLGATPLGRSGLLVAKTLGVLAVEVAQVALIAVVAWLLGWQPVGSVPAAVVLLVLGTAAFASLGLLLAGTLRAEATLAVANGLYLLLIAVGGVVIPAGRLPATVEPLVSLLPSAALGQGLRDVLLHGESLPLGSVAVLLVWTAIGGVAASRTFRWS